MDKNRFDDLTKALAGPRSRRSVLGLLGAAVGGILAGAGTASAAPPPTKPSKCYGEGSSCTNAKQCCSGTCTNRRCAGGTAPQCTSAANCPGQDTECQKRTCEAGVCGFVYAPQYTPISQQKQGDCFTDVCDGAGGIVPVYDGNDAPIPPTQCVFSYCGADGMPQFELSPLGYPCNENGGTFCDGAGQCITGGGQCMSGFDCPGEDTECQKRTCFGGFCGMDFAPPGVPTMQQTQGDCLLDVCDGMGNITVKPFGDDAPVTDNECKVALCGADGLPHIEPKPSGAPCSQNGGTACDGNGACL